MVSSDDVRDYVTSLFIMLNKKTVILFRIEFLVVFATLVFFAMFLMDFFRRAIHNSFMRAIFSVSDAVSDSIVLYLLGAMQSTPFKNQLFPIWALVLVNFRYSADYISGYGVPDHRGRRFTEWRNVFKLLGSAFLNWTRGSSFTGPLWSVWCLQIVRSAYRLFSHCQALRSVWHGRSSQLVAEHLRTRHDGNSQVVKPVVTNPMEGYNYLVYGETRRHIKLKKPQYALDTSAPLITLEKIWTHIQEKDLKDLPLAFALSRLLRCRLEDVTLHPCISKINRELVKNIIIDAKQVGTSDALKIMELQLAFVHDYFNTRYPMVFYSGHPSLFITLFLSMMTIAAVSWLAMDIGRLYTPPEGEFSHLVKGFNIDMIITWTFILLMIGKEVWEMVTYLLSDWTSLILVCEYVQRRCETTKKSIDTTVTRMRLRFSRAKITDKRWHGFIDQYVFLQSYDDMPKVWNFFHNLTTGIIPKKNDGAKLNSAIKVPEYVKKAVLKKLSTIVEEEPRSSLPRVLKSLSNSHQLQNYKAYTAPQMSSKILLPTSSHIILVWHIASSLCEVELATKPDGKLSNPGFPCSLLSWLTSCCSSKSYLMDVGEKKDGVLSWFTNCYSSKKLADELREPYTVANSLSRYCAYLVVTKPDMIPDSFLVPKIVFQNTVESARDGILKYCDSLERRYKQLKTEAEKPIEDSDKGDVLKQGAVLGKELLNLPNEEDRWEILAEVWTELLIHIAPTLNAQAHRKCLSRGEFITHIWALLWHCGIQSSSLWPNEVALGNNNALGAPPNNGVGNENNMDKTEQACPDISNSQIGSNAPGSAEIKGIQEHETGNSRRGVRIMEGTEISEIEEGTHDAIVEDTKFQRRMARWPNPKHE